MNNAPIGIFDSGVGGLTVARAIGDQLPNESLVYIADTAHSPYGPKPIADVRRFGLEVLDTLMEQGVSTLVLTTEKGSTTLNLSLLCEGQTDTQRVVLRQLGDSAFLTVGLRCRRDLIVGR